MSPSTADPRTLPAALLDRATDLKVRVWAKGGGLVADHPERLPADLRYELRERQVELAAWLARPVLVFDLETDSPDPHERRLSDSVRGMARAVHCLGVANPDSGQRWLFSGPTYSDGSAVPNRAGDLADGLVLLSTARQLAAHNGLSFDLPVLARLHGWQPGWDTQVVDTLLTSSVVWAHQVRLDEEAIARGQLTKKVKPGSMALAAWGHRLRCNKGEYSGSWHDYCHEMRTYCEQDVELCAALLVRIRATGYLSAPLAMEHALAPVFREMEDRGVCLDVPALIAQANALRAERAALLDKLSTLFVPQWRRLDTFRPTRDDAKKVWHDAAGTAHTGVVSGQTYERFHRVPFNPNSPRMVSAGLIGLGCTTLTRLTGGGAISTDKEAIEVAGLTHPEARVLARYKRTAKRLSMIAGNVPAPGEAPPSEPSKPGKVGKSKARPWTAYLRVGGDGAHRLHVHLKQNRAFTGRTAASSPNLQQVPRGPEYRGLFVPSPGMRFLNADLEGLELRALAHHTGDRGYIAKIVNGRKSDCTDIHSLYRVAFGLKDRATAKLVGLAATYGGGALRLGKAVARDRGITGLDEDGVRALGEETLALYARETPGYTELCDRLTYEYRATGTLIGLDGRVLHPRAKRTALNTLLQNFGAVAAKRWTLLSAAALAGVAHLVLMVHDELLFEFDRGIGPAGERELMALICAKAIEAGEFYGSRCPLTAESAVGDSWAQTHS